MEDNIFDKIYALRINFMDVYYDEKSIIYNIKKNLHKYDGYETDDELNQVIIDFYKTYDINITTIDLDSIKVVNQPEPIENLFNLINSTFLPMDLNYSNNNQSTESVYDNESISIDYNNSSVNQQENNSDDEDEVNNSENESNNTEAEPNNPCDDEIENTLNPELDSNVNYNPLYNSNGLFTFNPNQNISSDQFLNVINMFNIIMSHTEGTNYNPSEYEDVVVTLDEQDYNKLESIKYSDLKNKDKEKKCSICLVDFEDDDMLLKLPCYHYFHRQCVEEWLKEYDYKCPVCRHECGKTKNNV